MNGANEPRRGGRRINVDLPVLFETEYLSQKAWLRDFSLGGLGLKNVVLGRPGEVVTIVLGDARFTGRISWAKRGRCGVDVQTSKGGDGDGYAALVGRAL